MNAQRQQEASVRARHAAPYLGTMSGVESFSRRGLALITLFLVIAPAIYGDCRCRRPEKNDSTRLGGNEAIVLVLKDHFRELTGLVEAFENEPAKDVLVEVFDKPDYLVDNKPWADRPQQKRLKACLTSTDGRFCLRGLPSGAYELRMSKDSGWDVTHVYVVLDCKAGKKEQIKVRMHIGV